MRCSHQLIKEALAFLHSILYSLLMASNLTLTLSESHDFICTSVSSFDKVCQLLLCDLWLSPGIISGKSWNIIIDDIKNIKFNARPNIMNSCRRNKFTEEIRRKGSCIIIKLSLFPVPGSMLRFFEVNGSYIRFNINNVMIR